MRNERRTATLPLVQKLFHKRPSALHSAAGSLARRENAGAYARWARLPTALSPVLKQLLSGEPKATALTG
jgi:hypothetical protein